MVSVPLTVDKNCIKLKGTEAPSHVLSFHCRDKGGSTSERISQRFHWY